MEIELGNQTNRIVLTDDTLSIINKLYDFEFMLEELASENTAQITPVFVPLPPTNYAIDYNKTLGASAPGEFIHIVYNSSQPILTIENTTSKEMKNLSHFETWLISNYIFITDFVYLDFQVDECKMEPCDITTLTVSSKDRLEGYISNTIKYNDQSKNYLINIDRVASLSKFILNN